MEEKNKNTDKKIAAEIIFWISCGTGVLSLAFIFFDNPLLYKEEVYAQLSNKVDWIKYLTVDSILLIIVLVIFFYFNFLRKRCLDWAYFFWAVGILGLFYTCFIINSTGGVLSSPFTAIYPIFASTVITLFPKLRTRAIMVILITFFLASNYYEQVKKLSIPEVDSESDNYKMFYTLIIFLLIVLTIIIDGLSRRKKE